MNSSAVTKRSAVSCCCCWDNWKQKKWNWNCKVTVESLSGTGFHVNFQFTATPFLSAQGPPSLGFPLKSSYPTLASMFTWHLLMGLRHIGLTSEFESCELKYSLGDWVSEFGRWWSRLPITGWRGPFWGNVLFIQSFSMIILHCVNLDKVFFWKGDHWLSHLLGKKVTTAPHIHGRHGEKDFQET